MEERQGHVLKVLEWQAEELGHTLLVLAHHGLWLLEEGQGLSTVCARAARAQQSPGQALQVTVLPGPQLSFL